MSIARLPPVLALHIKRFEVGTGHLQVAFFTLTRHQLRYAHNGKETPCFCLL